MPTREPFGERLSFAIEQSGLSIEDVAQRLYLPADTLRYELSARQELPKLLVVEQLGRLCQALGVSWAWLVEGRPSPAARRTVHRLRASLARDWMEAEELDLLCNLLEAIG